MNRALGFLILLSIGCSGDQVRETEPVYQGKTLDYWIRALGDQDANAREAATLACSEIGPRAKRAIPALVQRLSDSELTVRLGAANALGKIGPDAVVFLVRVLKESKPRQEGVGPTALQPLAHETSYVKQKNAIESAAIAIGILGEQAKAAIAPLVSALEDEDAGVRLRAAEALGKIGKPAEEAIPALQRLAKNEEDKSIGSAARDAIRQISPGK